MTGRAFMDVPVGLPRGALVTAALVTALLALPPLSAATRQEVDLRLSPDEAFPLQEITIEGLPDSVAGLGLRAVPLDARGREAGEPVPLYAVRLEAGEPVFVAPPHPAGLDAAGRFRIEPETLTTDDPPMLTVRALPAADGQTARLLADLERSAEAIARAGGADPERLRSGPIEDVPLHLVGTAVSLRTLDAARGVAAGEALEWADRWLATRASGAALSDLADELASLPAPPPEALGYGAGSTTAGDGRAGVGARGDGRAGLSASFDSSPLRFASAGSSIVRTVERRGPDEPRSSASRPPWQKVEICRKCPGALNHWMTVRSELAQGYGNLAERLARDRDLFDFTESLKGPDPDPTTQRLGEGLSRARSEARSRAGNPLKNLKTPRAVRGLALLEAVTGIAELTIGLNDKFLVSLLPSELLPASVRVIPSRFNEDDRRAEPTDPGAGEWRLLVTARSGQLELTAQEMLDYFSRLKSIAGKTESGVFGQGSDDTRSGLCVPGGATDGDATVGTGEAACDLAGVAIDNASNALKSYQQARETIDRVQDARGADEDERLPEPIFELIRDGHYVWAGIDVSNPKWSTARPLDDCVRVMAQTWRTAESPWSSMSYSPADPAASWGAVADQENPPNIGIKPAEVGDCEVRISTRVDRFGEAPPVHLDVPIRVDAITVQVDPSPLTVEPGDTVTFEPTVRHADSVDVAWSETSGSGAIVNCEAGIDGWPCYDWIAPELEEGECRRPVTVTAESLARRGLRVSGEPVREGSAAVRVVDPEADMRIAYQGDPVSEITLDPEERVPLTATGPGARDGEVRWTASAGSIGPTGRRTSYVAPGETGTYHITASSDQSASCTPSITVTVIGEERPCYWNARMTGTIDGESVQRSLSGESVSPDYGTTLLDGRIMSGMGLGQAPGSEETETLTFFLDGPLERRSYRLGRRQRSGAIVSTSETPWGTVELGEIQITLLEPDTLIVGGFAVGYGALAAPDFDDARMEIQGEFVWSPSCPTSWDMMRDIGERTDRFLENRDPE